MNRILLAGAKGYLGKYIAAELKKQNYFLRVLIRNKKKFESFKINVDEIITAEITDKSSILNCCKDIDIIISTVGITKQTDGLSYLDVDYQANINLLEEAKKSGVKKFIYVSVLNGEQLRDLKICEAKEKFVDALKVSEMNYCVIRPNGFFSDMTEFYNMAKRGKVFVFGNGQFKSNPIHGEDLAEVCVNAIKNDETEVEVGGPEILSQNDIANIAFQAASKKVKISRLPEWLHKTALKLASLFMSKQKYGPFEFFMNVMAMDMIAPKYGKHTLKEYFKSLNNFSG